MGGSIGKSNSKNKSQSYNRSNSAQNVWGGQSDYLRDIYSQGQDLYGNSRRMIGDLSQAYMDAADSPYIQNAQQQYGDTINGAYLPGGEQFDRNISAITDSVRRGLDSQFAGGGRYGSGLHQAAIAEEVGNQAMGLYGQERANQMQAMAAAPQVANMGLNNMMMAANLPWNQLSQYAGLVGGPTVLGRSSSTGTSMGKGKSNSWNLSGGLFG
jgi:hypothetical protein